MPAWAGALIIAVLVLALVLLAILVAAGSSAFRDVARDVARVRGGASRARALPPVAVVDTLNLAGWLRPGGVGGSPTAAEAVAAIDATAATLRKRFRRVVYVVKPARDTAQGGGDQFEEAMRGAAERNGVEVALARPYDEPWPTPLCGHDDASKHAARAADDFYANVLAKRLGGVVLTGDRMRDFELFRRCVAPFVGTVFAPGGPPGGRRDPVRPDAFVGMRPQPRIGFEEAGLARPAA
jgi:hypothetical protein